MKNGAGVYGLRRALVLAGNETQVLSLWQVSDTATRDLMLAYYKLLKAGGSRTEALRQVQLMMISGANIEEVGAQRGMGLDKTVCANTMAGSSILLGSTYPVRCMDEYGEHGP